ncbi:Transcriptional repressor NF-X1 [Fasciola gigantica]|uniref:Transcriptional repressor NF-X1 n=1 Tax=Fasciola gigantica TaxID=46835 RepID=A0A504Y818_FASGI|nr:Transcriptional repressor NF-X1 [Fasciola gigantica]
MLPNYGPRGPRAFFNCPGVIQWVPLEESSTQEFIPSRVRDTSEGPWHPDMPQWDQRYYPPSRVTHVSVSYPPYRHQQLHGRNPNTTLQFCPRPQYFGNRYPFSGQHVLSRRRFPSHQLHYGHPDFEYFSRGMPSSSHRPHMLYSGSVSNSSRGPRIPSRVRRGGQLRNPTGSLETAQCSAEAEDKTDGTRSPTRSGTPDTVSGSYLNAAASAQNVGEKHSNLREKLIDELRNGTYQCLVCISRVRQRDQTWSCSTCFHIYHLSCIKMWADKCRKGATENQTTEVIDAPWRCPACQTEYSDYGDMMSYFCFCRRIRNPEYHPARTNIPHSCDEVCGKLRPKNQKHTEILLNNTNACTHPCTEYVSSGNVSGDRISCMDVVPTCPNVCDRPKPICGHPCPDKCHGGPCPPCKQSLTIKCRCGRTSKELTCLAFSSMVENGTMELLCERQCNKKKACGRHKCKKKCCELTVHPCGEVCGRRLSCGQHNCEDPCHPGSCGTCWRGVIYTEVTCRCGFSVVPPPQPCGSGPPECPRPCDRPHACDHPVRHTCHNEPTCPPCTVLLTKECPGGHGVQFSMPCFQPVLSCGRMCGHPLPNCSHTCQRNCHSGGCLESITNGETAPVVCTQPCQKPRPDCGHPCSLPCHEAKNQTCLQAATAGSKRTNESGNPRTATLPRCRFLVEVICPCGQRKDKQMCYQVQLKHCMLLQNDDSPSKCLGKSQNLVQLSLGKKQIEPLPFLACDSTCNKASEAAALAQTNSRFADTSSWTRGLDLNPEQSLDNDAVTADRLPFEKPEYSKWLRNYALHNFAFAVSVERQFYGMVLQVVKATDADGVRTVAHHFPPMKDKRRRFIHELSEFYGIESHSMDPEPGRHVMVLARRGETKFPGGATDHRGSLTALLQREFPDTVQLIDGVRMPTKTEMKKHAPPSSTTRFSYAQILSTHSDPP